MARRVRRLLPAALVTVVGVLVVTAVLDSQVLRSVGWDAVAALLNVFNWRTASAPGGYGEIFAVQPAPLDHFWSLAIEEQFYLVVPAALALTRRPVAVLVAMTAVGVGGVALWWGSIDAYVATPVRALEIAAGAALALAATRLRAVRRFGRAASRSARAGAPGSAFVVAAAAAIASLAVFTLGPNDAAVFRGGPQLMALCWIVLIAASLRGGLLAPLLSVAPLRWLGTRSYAVYLFHWPLAELTDWGAVPVIVVTLTAAEASYRLIEMPIRRGTGRTAVLGLVAAVAVVAAIAGVVAAAASPVRAAGERVAEFDELPAWAPVPADGTSDDRAGGVDGSAAGTSPAERTEGIPAAGFGEMPAWAAPRRGAPEAGFDASSEFGSTTPIVTVVGDSAAVHVADGLRRWADADRSLAVVDRALTTCSPLAVAGSSWRSMRSYEEDFGGFPPEAPCRDEDIEPGSILVLVADHGTPMHDHRHADGSWRSILDEDFAYDLTESYRRLVNNARERGARVVFTTAPRVLAHPRYPPGHPMQEPRRSAAYNALLGDLVAELGPEGVGLIDTAMWLDASGREGPYPRSDGLHIDFTHTEPFAADIVGPALLELLAE